MDMRVTAKTNARPSAARPMSCAPTTEALPGSADVLATARAPAFCDASGDGDGWMVGKSPAALPPGLRLGLGAGATPGMPGRLPTGSGEVTVIGVGGSVIVMAAVALGSFGRCAALPMTVRLTDVTAVAVAGTVTCACSCRGADFESIAPRSHDDVPSELPQPKLNPGIALAGDAWSLMVASGTFPPVIQALTVQVAASPRWLLAWARAIWTQSRTTEVLATVLAPGCFFRVCLGVGKWVGVGLLLGVALWVGVGLRVGVCVGVGVGECVGVAVVVAVPVFAGVAVPDGLPDVADGVAFALLVALAEGSADGLAVAVGEAEPDEAGVLAAVAEPDGVAVGLLVPLLLALAGDFDAELVAGGFVVVCLVPDAVAVGVAVGDWVSVLVLAGVVPAPGLFDRVCVAAELPVEEADGVVDGAVVVGVTVVGVGVGVCVAVRVGVGVGVGVELGGGLGSQSAWHDSSPTVAAVTAAE